MRLIRREQIRQFGTKNLFKPTIAASEQESANITVFLSHSHDEKDSGIVEEVERFLAFFGASIYVDWADKGMKKMSWEERVLRLRQKMDSKKRFILLATNTALSSPWISWELGYADGSKGDSFRDFIAILPIAEENGVYQEHNQFAKVYSQIICTDPEKDWQAFEPQDAGNWVVRSPFSTMQDRTLKQWLEGPPLFD
jgi:hypothetical protein